VISASEIRRSFLDYFARKGHQVVPSAPLVPRADPTLLFTNAGMVQFKKVFLGHEKRSYSRAASAQKCLRVGGKHNDLENVGRTRRHHTFFEMLGNFSFGDYFKEEAIRLAWEYLTRELELPEERMYASIYQEDDEAEELWKKVTGIPGERIYRLGADENYWSMGDTGPCGPCSEILYDQGAHLACGPECEIGVCDCDRYLEIWNLVFMQYDRDEAGTMEPLPRPCIDTGMGLERIAAICQGVYSNFDTDLFSGLIQDTASKAGAEYGRDHDTDTALRVVADHSRAVPFMIVDGILPSNEGRGYVLRRLIRRACRFGRFLGLHGPFFHEICARLAREMGGAYPELEKASEFIVKVVHREEEHFGKTLDKGLALLQEDLDSLRSEGRDVVPGESVFKLYDTFGFPVDIVKDVAERQGFTVDEPGFDEYMRRQRERSKASWAGSGEIDVSKQFATYLESGLQTEFVGYESLQTSSRIVALLSLSGDTVRTLNEGEEGFLVTARTPFYGESGGQVGDRGRITGSAGRAEVEDTLNPASGFIVHRVRIQEGSLSLEQEVSLSVDEGTRVATARNHTCTHLLHAALRKVLGQHVKQSGSLVGPDRLRFDFTHIHPVSGEELRMVEDEVNRAVLADIELQARVVEHAQAEREEAVGLFAEKYEDRVRIIEVPGVSKELCGGTHLRATGQIGSFCVLSESGVAAGIRRIEAATGWNTLAHFRRQRSILDEACAALKTSPEQLAGRIGELQEQVKRMQKEKDQLEARLASAGSGSVFDRIEEIGGVKVLATRVDLPEGSGMKGLRNMMDDLRSKFQEGVILLAAPDDGKAMLVLHVSRNLHEHFTAPGLIKEVAQEVGGSGGGRPDMAQAGGSNPAGIDSAIRKLKDLVAAEVQK
jgi:alanyl-tRNA synthetase